LKVLLVSSYLLVCAVIVFTVPTMVDAFPGYETYSTSDAAQATLLCTVVGAAVGFFVYRNKEEGPFLLQLFAWGLLIRMIVGIGIFIFNKQEFFGGDAITYDFYGWAQAKAWQGDPYYQIIANRFTEGQASAWGFTKSRR